MWPRLLIISDCGNEGSYHAARAECGGRFTCVVDDAQENVGASDLGDLVASAMLSVGQVGQHPSKTGVELKNIQRTQILN